ncbi:TIGR04104 family putative zinc finger protein [Bacillus sp. FJAT-45037]|uniref:TIGR04104 family putative zinc finger protein n=1 Tax=Bacillus sp. FJAT-45037 TaxID=2011007 RepID=UPI000C24F65A|nr:TIGR04104 family putative zinc finger protein [Bacillus sp. FJAT-45037]
MSLPRCVSCNDPFTYRKLLFMFFRKQCPTCKKLNYLSTKSRIRGSRIAVLFVILYNVLLLLSQSFMLNVLVGFGIIIFIILIGPFLYQFKEVEEPLF